MKDLYRLAFDASKAESDRFWQVFNILGVINGAMIAFSNSGTYGREVTVVTAVLGIFICYLWRKIQARLGHWCKWWEDKLSELEPLYFAELNQERSTQQLPLLPQTIRVFRDRKPQLPSKTMEWWPGISTIKGGQFMPLFFIFGWLGLLVVRWWPELTRLICALCGCGRTMATS